MDKPIGNAKARAPGKIIIAGEHFVVLGAPAVAMAIDLYAYAMARPANRGRIEVEAEIPLHLLGRNNGKSRPADAHKLLEPLRLAAREVLAYSGKNHAGISLDVECNIPVGAGLGSSASTIVAIITAVARSQAVSLERKEIFKIAFSPESYLHGKPSGVDQAACTYGGVIRFSRPYTIRPLRLNHVPLFLVCDTGLHHSTKSLVGAVVQKSRREKEAFEGRLDRAKEIVEGVLRALKNSDDEDLGLLMNQNHELLVEIGVSHPKLNRFVRVARAYGALGAKMTGAGGGGCMVALCPDNTARSRMARILSRQGGIPYEVAMDPVGALALGDERVLK